MGGDADPADQATTTNRDDQRSHIRLVLENLEGDRAASSDHVWIVVCRDEGDAALAREAQALGLSIVVGFAVLDQFGARTAQRVDLRW